VDEDTVPPDEAAAEDPPPLDEPPALLERRELLPMALDPPMELARDDDDTMTLDAVPLLGAALDAITLDDAMALDAFTLDDAMTLEDPTAEEDPPLAAEDAPAELLTVRLELLPPMTEEDDDTGLHTAVPTPAPGQGSHATEPAFGAAVSAGHNVHNACAVTAAKDPGGHNAQVPAAMSLKLPAGQASHPVAVALA